MYLLVCENCLLWVSFERSKNKRVKTLSQLRCFRMPIVVLEYGPITFTERRCERDRESVENERSNLQLPSDSCCFKVARFSSLLTGNCGPRLASEHSANMLIVFMRFFNFSVCWGGGGRVGGWRSRVWSKRVNKFGMHSIAFEKYDLDACKYCHCTIYLRTHERFSNAFR